MAKNKNIQVPIALAVKIELFKRGCFDFITVKDGKKHEKQEKALQILTDTEHVELLVVLSLGQVLPGFFLCVYVIQDPNGLSDVLS